MTERHDSEENGNARAARRRRDGADRARDWRAEAKMRGQPLPRDADSALSEGIAFLLARARRDGVNIGYLIDPAELGLAAKYILERRGFDPVVAGKVIKDRLHRRDDHKRSDYVPSLCPGDPLNIPLPEGRESWSSPIDQIVRYFDGPHAITRAN